MIFPQEQNIIHEFTLKWETWLFGGKENYEEFKFSLDFFIFSFYMFYPINYIYFNNVIQLLEKQISVCC